MILCGHWHEADGEYHQVSTNDAGHPVYEMISNYQDRPASGRGYLRRIEFHSGGGSEALDRIRVRSYSPVVDESNEDPDEEYEDADSEFSSDLDFDERFGASGDSGSGDGAESSVAFQQGVEGYEGTVDTNLVEDDPETNFESESTVTVDANEPHGSQHSAQALVRFEDIIGSGEAQVPSSSTITSATLSAKPSTKAAAQRFTGCSRSGAAERRGIRSAMASKRTASKRQPIPTRRPVQS